MASPEVLRWRNAVVPIAQRYGIDPDLLLAIIKIESGGNARARNAASGATGLGQVMPSDSRIHPEWFKDRPTSAQLLDPATNIEWMARVYKGNLDRVGGDPGKAYYYYGEQKPEHVQLFLDAVRDVKGGAAGPQAVDMVAQRAVRSVLRPQVPGGEQPAPVPQVPVAIPPAARVGEAIGGAASRFGEFIRGLGRPVEPEPMPFGAPRARVDPLAFLRPTPEQEAAGSQWLQRLQGVPGRLGEHWGKGEIASGTLGDILGLISEPFEAAERRVAAPLAGIMLGPAFRGEVPQEAGPSLGGLAVQAGASAAKGFQQFISRSLELGSTEKAFEETGKQFEAGPEPFPGAKGLATAALNPLYYPVPWTKALGAGRVGLSLIEKAGAIGKAWNALKAGERAEIAMRAGLKGLGAKSWERIDTASQRVLAEHLKLRLPEVAAPAAEVAPKLGVPKPPVVPPLVPPAEVARPVPLQKPGEVEVEWRFAKQPPEPLKGPPKGPVPEPAPIPSPEEAAAKVRASWDVPKPPREPLSSRLSKAPANLWYWSQEALLDTYYRARRLAGKVGKPEHDALVQAITLNPGAGEAGITRSLITIEKAEQAIGGDVTLRATVNDLLRIRHEQSILEAMPVGRKVPSGLTKEGLGQAEEALRIQLGDKFPQVERAAEAFRDRYASELMAEVELGRVSPELYAFLREKYPWYNPTYYLGKVAEGGVPLGRRLPPGQLLQRLHKTGLEEAVLSPYEALPSTLVKNAINRGNQDIINKAVDVALKDPQTRALMVKADGPGARVLPQWVNGEVTYWKPPEWLYKELIDFQQRGSSAAVNLIGAVNSIPRAAFVSQNPIFVIANFLNDALPALITEGITPIRSLVGLGRLGSAERLQRIQALAGGMQQRFYGKSLEEIERIAKGSGGRILTDPKALGQAVKEAVPNLGEALEQAPRRAVLLRALDKHVPGWQKMNPEEVARRPEVLKAVTDSIEVTINFARGGWLVKSFNPIIIFLNANVQGTALPFRALARNPAARWRLAAVLGAKMALDAYNMSYPEYSEVPADIRYGTIFVMLPSEEYDSQGRRRPKPVVLVPNMREWGSFLSPMTYLLEPLRDQPQRFDRFWQAVAPRTIPLYGDMPGPPPLIELMEQMTNFDTWRAQAIVSPEKAMLPKPEQFDPWTSPTMKLLAGAIGQSPLRAEHAVRGIFGGAGAVALSFPDFVARLVEDAQMDDRTRALLRDYEAIAPPAVPPDRVIVRKREFLAALSEDDRKTLEGVLERPKLGLPVVEPLKRKVLPERGGEVGRISAQQAAEKAGISLEQTQRAGQTLSAVSEKWRVEQARLDTALESGQITKEQWKNARPRAEEYAGALSALGIFYPGAAQLATGEGRRKYAEAVAAVAAANPSWQVRGQTLAAGYGAIEPPETAPGVYDWDAFYKMRDEFKAALSEDDRLALDEWRRASLSPTERQYERDRDLLQPYWNADKEMLTLFPADGAQLWKEYQDASARTDPASVTRAVELGADKRIKAMNKAVAGIKAAYRLSQPDIDAALEWYGNRGIVFKDDLVRLSKELQTAMKIHPKVAAFINKILGAGSGPEGYGELPERPGSTTSTGGSRKVRF